MKNFLSIALIICMTFTMTACGNENGNTVNTNEEIVTVSPGTTQTIELDNQLLTENGTINFTASDYRIVDETDDGYVIITLTKSTVKAIYKITTYENVDAAKKVVEDKAISGEIKNHRGLTFYDNYVVYNLDATDETYGKFFTMNRTDILKAFGRDTDTTAVETEAEHNHDN